VLNHELPDLKQKRGEGVEREAGVALRLVDRVVGLGAVEVPREVLAWLVVIGLDRRLKVGAQPPASAGSSSGR